MFRKQPDTATIKIYEVAGLQISVTGPFYNDPEHKWLNKMVDTRNLEGKTPLMLDYFTAKADALANAKRLYEVLTDRIKAGAL